MPVYGTIDLHGCFRMLQQMMVTINVQEKVRIATLNLEIGNGWRIYQMSLKW